MRYKVRLGLLNLPINVLVDLTSGELAIREQILHSLGRRISLSIMML